MSSAELLEEISSAGIALLHNATLPVDEIFRRLSIEDRIVLEEAYTQSQKELRDFQNKLLDWHLNDMEKKRRFLLSRGWSQVKPPGEFRSSEEVWESPTGFEYRLRSAYNWQKKQDKKC